MLRDIKNSDNICLSGGAQGADVFWGQEAFNKGHQVIHWSFDGHKFHSPINQTVKLDLDLLKEADIHLEKANKTLKRFLPYHKLWIINLLRRNWFQVKYTKRVYGVGEIKNNKIQGGTAWAFEMAKNINVKELYFFDQITKQWFIWDNIWVVYNKLPITPYGIWTGIGTRKLSSDGEKAIKSVFS